MIFVAFLGTHAMIFLCSTLVTSQHCTGVALILIPKGILPGGGAVWIADEFSLSRPEDLHLRASGFSPAGRLFDLFTRKP